VYGFPSNKYYRDYVGDIFITSNKGGDIIYGILPIIEPSMTVLSMVISDFQSVYTLDINAIKQFAHEKGLEHLCGWYQCLYGEFELTWIELESSHSGSDTEPFSDDDDESNNEN
jgi:hypothetical protein